MKQVLVCLRDLKGRGITFCHKPTNRLLIEGNTKVLKQVDLSPIQNKKAFFIHALPPDKVFTIADIENAIECYEERTAILWHGGTGIDIQLAKNRAMPCVRRFMASL